MLAVGVVQDDLVILSPALPLLPRLGQAAGLLIPFGLEGVGDKPIVRVDKHEATLRQVRVDLGALDRAGAELIGLLVPGTE